MKATDIYLPFVGRWGEQRIVVELKLREEFSENRELPLHVDMFEGGGCLVTVRKGGEVEDHFYPNWEAVASILGASLDAYTQYEIVCGNPGCLDVKQAIKYQAESRRPWTQEVAERFFGPHLGPEAY